MSKSALATGLAAIGAFATFAAAPALAEQGDGELAAQKLANGEQGQAITALEIERQKAPEDPGVLINLGIAYAHLGDDQKAHDLFRAALASSEPIELETADGRLTDSRRLARKAIRMLERGEFRPSADRLSLREK